MSEQHVCVNKDEIERLKKQVETLQVALEKEQEQAEVTMKQLQAKIANVLAEKVLI